ncbi:winged helix-turn-helix transcriptional regulator [Granulicella cerasi]|uniref:Winged helix-turn-helix transcriptional regulator n=1 Tax=Granulicella cerasi TaxID=741063 RepID=A0ABW1Z6B3_9BACT|nr:helix-turn-helix domain-containing protein [Granulicella cerasi]
MKTGLVTRIRKGRGNLLEPMCPSRTVLEHVTSRWGMLVMVQLLEGKCRFSELARTIGGVSEKMLAQTLHHLEADGMVKREVFPTVPPRVEYSLTPLGEGAGEQVRDLALWVEENLASVLKQRERYATRKLAAAD